MAGSVNKVILIGNLGANPELKYLPSGQPVCELRIATNDVWMDKNNQRQERTEWHRVEVWAKQAEHCSKYLQKGSKVYVEGTLRTDSWDDKTTGEKRYSTKIRALTVQFLDPRAGEGAPMRSAPSAGAPPAGGAPSGPADYGPPAGGGGSDDDIPF